MPTLAHKIRLTPTLKQAMYFRNACGTARYKSRNSVGYA